MVTFCYQLSCVYTCHSSSVPATYHLMEEDLRKMMTIVQRLKEDKEEAKQEVSIANSEAWGSRTN